MKIELKEPLENPIGVPTQYKAVLENMSISPTPITSHF